MFLGWKMSFLDIMGISIMIEVFQEDGELSVLFRHVDVMTELI